jgi:hypothetical protein
MREKMIEQKLFKAVRDSGGQALKLVSPSMAGVPAALPDPAADEAGLQGICH